MTLSPQLRKRLNEAVGQHEAGRLERAEALYAQIAADAPRVAAVFELWGRLAEQQGRLDDAIRRFRYALQLEPRSVARGIQLAGVQMAAGRAADAEQVLRRLTAEQPRSFEAWTALGFALKLQARLDEALACHERAVQNNPRSAEGWQHYGFTLTLAGRNFQALEKQDRALALNPRLTGARYGRAQALQRIYRTEEAVADYDAVIRAEPKNLEARSFRLFALQSLDGVSRERLLAEHRAYGELVGRGPAVLPGCDPAPDRRLRVAILSPDFRTHSCAYFIEPLLRALDPAAFELYLYHDHFIEDAVSARLRSHAVVWRKIVGQTAGVFERLVRSDQPDVLVDLTGHVGNTIRLPSLAKRLAPVQITYLGYPDTTGVPAMDYRFTDAIADPPGEADRFATETLVRFAPVAWTYLPPAAAPDVSPPPSAAGGPVTFGCFSSPTKFTDPLLAAWARLLARVPESRLLLKGRDFHETPVREAMLQRLHRQGVPLERVVLLPRAPDTASHLAQYAQMDIALDTFPYTGTTTTCEALWMGRPVVTLCGDRHAARVGASLLTAVGHPEWIAQSADDYVRIAAELADRRPAGAVAGALRDAVRRSALMDYTGQAACFARALRACWQERGRAARG